MTPGAHEHPSLHAMLALCRLAVSAEARTPAVHQAAAEQLAAAFGDTALVLPVVEPASDPPELDVAGVADPRPDAAAELQALKGTRFAADRGFSRHVLESGRSLRLPATTPEVVLVGRPELRGYIARFGMRSLIIAPMVLHGHAFGEIAMIRNGTQSPYAAEDEELVQAAASILALATSCGLSTAVGVPVQEPRAGPRATAPDLTGREREVLSLLALGYTNREIAEQLVLSVRTVEWHRARLQGKLGVTGRAALALVAREHGLVG